MDPFLHTCYLRLEASRDHREDHKAEKTPKAGVKGAVNLPAFFLRLRLRFFLCFLLLFLVEAKSGEVEEAN